jgi:hypothetical protein
MLLEMAAYELKVCRIEHEKNIDSLRMSVRDGKSAEQWGGHTILAR